jgi:hypothetical protein
VWHLKDMLRKAEKSNIKDFRVPVSALQPFVAHYQACLAKLKEVTAQEAKGALLPTQPLPADMRVPLPTAAPAGAPSSVPAAAAGAAAGAAAAPVADAAEDDDSSSSSSEEAPAAKPEPAARANKPATNGDESSDTTDTSDEE